MKTKTKTVLVAALTTLAAASVFAQNQPIIGYWLDSSGRVVKNTWGECWRTSSWTPALALAECDPGLIQKVTPAPEPKAAPAPAPVVTPPPPPPPPPPPVETYKTVISEKPIRLEGANFATGSSKLLPGANAKLDEVVQQAKDHPEISFDVSGYTDNVGRAKSNLKLSQARADAVKAYLVGKGVAADRITTKGYGQENPVADNATADGRAQNRRVEIRYTDKVQTRVRVTQ